MTADRKVREINTPVFITGKEREEVTEEPMTILK